jgi:hypothetical protein
MANISLLSRLVNGVQRQVDLSTNTLVVQAIQINGTLLSSSGATAGSTLVGDNNSYTNFTPSAATVKGALSGIDTALGSVSGSAANKTLSNLTSPTAINQDLLPSSDNVRNVGSSSLRYTALYTYQLSAGSAQLVLNGSSISANSLNIQNLADPVLSTDAATKRYVDTLAQGISWKNIVRSATTAALPANTYSNGSSGVGATLTGNSNGALSAQDGVTLVLNDRLLVKNEATAANNGIYYVSQVGDGSHPYILTRALDCDVSAQFVGATVEVGTEATTQAKHTYFQSTASPITVGTTSISWTQISSALVYNFRNGLALTGANVDVVPGDTSLTSTTGSLTVNLNAAGAIVTSSGLMINLATTNPGLAITSNKLDVKYNPAGAIVASSSGIAWNPDGSSLEISSNAARIKTTAYDQATITGGGGSAAAVAYAPSVQRVVTAGQSFSANTTYAVRWGIPGLGETAGRVYAADYNAATNDKFWVIGLFNSGTSVSAGNSITIVEKGDLALGLSDANFTSGDQGYPVWLGASGTYLANSSVPTSTSQADVKLGIAKTASVIEVSIDIMGVN